jgi:hypothetical protein
VCVSVHFPLSSFLFHFYLFYFSTYNCTHFSILQIIKCIVLDLVMLLGINKLLVSYKD